MDEQKMRELLDFAKDEKRLDAAFDNVLKSFETGRIRIDEFPLAASPLRVGTLKDDRECVVRLLEKAAGTSLNVSQRQILYGTVAGLPDSAGIYDIFDALDETGSLAPFVEALRNFLDEAVCPTA
ncbi:hypothetical protein GIW05_00450 [Pseudomonas syringae]|uniref:hypothetical protein n=1 Tax=Pseudomonas syringae TaxID=317 RepID=UPI001F2037B5|nr:hypothetical protein [Pseudomonas syringae]MCF5381992.1 hypothetical protein [Pseudomonas syringae]MCF5419475.1 hypothetical protein [Pseudomonas syringae]MCF5452021.1 hypothetical protein [Pseudomonas syringae]MCF5456308.1 hypothetical protein [Pseudomonas syringae]